MNLTHNKDSTLSPDFGYWCFISYRHIDNKDERRNWANWLHQEIEHYEVPAELVGTLNDSGTPIPARIYPVFRDEESLAADAHLGEGILESLRASRTMLVICSPRAAVSKYVEDEIAYFQSLDRGDRIITAIIDGEPNHAEKECFPPSLRLNHTDSTSMNVNDGPLAADFRLQDASEGYTSLEGYRLTLINSNTPNKQVKLLSNQYEARIQLMKLKILAGILDVKLEKLRDRDKAYQLAVAKRKSLVLRRWLGAVAILALLSMTGGWIAYVQRQVANKQSEIAIQQAYRSQIRLGASLIQKGELAGARSLLLETKAAARGWEWAYLLSRCGASPKSLDALKSDPRWLKSSEIEQLKSTLDKSIKANEIEPSRDEIKRQIKIGKRQVLSNSKGRGGSYSIVYQSDPPTTLLSYWMGMYTDPASYAFSEDGSAIMWSGEYGEMGGRRANISSGDMLVETRSMSPLPNRLVLDISTATEDTSTTADDSLHDPSLLRFGPMSFGSSDKILADVSFEAGRAVTFAYDSPNGIMRLTRDLTQAPIHFKDRLILASSPEVSLIDTLASKKLDRKFCCWFDVGGKRLAILEGDGLELWEADASSKTSICGSGNLTIDEEDAMPPSFWGNTAVQIGKSRHIAGWLQTDSGRFLGIGSIDIGSVEKFLLNMDGAKIPEIGEFAYNVETSMIASPSGSRICYKLNGRNESFIQVWDGNTGEMLYEEHSSITQSIGFDPKGLFVAMVDSLGELSIRDDLNGRILRRYPGVQIEAPFELSVRRSPDGKRILISNLVIDASTFEDLLLLDTGTRISADWTTTVSWVNDRTAEITTISFWDVIIGRSKGDHLFLNERLILNELYHFGENDK